MDITYCFSFCPSVPLFCYTCVFPAISPLDCIRYPMKCPPGQLCLSSRAVGQKGKGASSHWTAFKWIKTEKQNRERPCRAQMCVWWFPELMIMINSGFQETTVWCCMRRAASCLLCVASLVKSTPWDSTSPSPMNAATHTYATELQHLLPPTGPVHYLH